MIRPSHIGFAGLVCCATFLKLTLTNCDGLGTMPNWSDIVAIPLFVGGGGYAAWRAWRALFGDELDMSFNQPIQGSQMSSAPMLNDQAGVPVWLIDWQRPLPAPRTIKKNERH